MIMESLTIFSIALSLVVIAISKRMMLYAARRPANGELERLKRWQDHIESTDKLINVIRKK